jgi:uncharacterized protein YjbJ (UPF0337 family)
MAKKITDNPKLEAKSKAENIAGKVQGKIGQGNSIWSICRHGVV